jgi:predicted negative regulator of RcsB-dependent stress response
MSNIDWLMSKDVMKSNLGPPMFFAFWVIFATVYITLLVVGYRYYRKRNPNNLTSGSS